MSLFLPSGAKHSSKIKVHELLDLRNKLMRRFDEHGKLSCERSNCAAARACFTNKKGGTWIIGKSFKFSADLLKTYRALGYKNFIVDGKKLERGEITSAETIFVCFRSYSTSKLEEQAFREAASHLGGKVECFFVSSVNKEITKHPTLYSCTSCGLGIDFGEKASPKLQKRINSRSLDEVLSESYPLLKKTFPSLPEVTTDSVLSQIEAPLDASLNQISPGQECLLRLIATAELNVSGVDIEFEDFLFSHLENNLLKDVCYLVSINNRVLTTVKEKTEPKRCCKLTAFRKGRGKLVVITGPIGSGKSRFLNGLNADKSISERYPQGKDKLKDTCFGLAGFSQDLKEHLTGLALSQKSKVEELFASGELSSVLNCSVSELAQLYPDASKRAKLLIELGYNKSLGAFCADASRKDIRKLQVAEVFSWLDNKSEKLVTLDHTISGFSEHELEVVLHEIRQALKRGNTFVVVTHSSDIMEAADEIYTT